MDETKRKTVPTSVPARDATTALTFDQGEATWDLLAAKLGDLIRRWEASGSPPVLAEFIPDEPQELRRLMLVELIKVDLGFRYKRRQPKLIEDYIAEFPELRGSSGVPCDLIFEEYQIRRRCGEAVDRADYFNRFPAQTRELANLLNVNAPTEATLVNRPHPEADVNVGERLDDFDLQAVLGEGAFAKVFLAWQRSLQRRVALKVSSDRGDEPQTLAQLDHPNIVRVYDQRQVPGRNLRLLYMRYLPGGTLLDVIKVLRSTPVELRSGKLLLKAVDAALGRHGESAPDDSANRRRIADMSWPEAVCFLGACLAEALDYAHHQGVLHRDIKPANVLLAADATPHLADFNVGCCSKLEGASPSAFFGGSFPYMSPEQIEAFSPAHARSPESLDGRCDLYSLAVTLWELLTGGRPFPDERISGDWGQSLAAVLVRRSAGIDRKTMASMPSNMPPGVIEILLKCLEADRDHRFQTAGELARELDLCLKPATRALIHPRPGWRTWVRRHPLIALYPTGFIPNLLAAWYNVVYNRKEIIDHLRAAEGMFRTLELFVNSLLFPLAIILFGIVAWPIARGLAKVQTGTLGDEQMANLRRQTLGLGRSAALICLGCWIAAGLTFPVGLHLTVPEMTFAFDLHFLSSLTLCGMIAIAYPLFAVTAICLRAIYPAFLPAGKLSSSDVIMLDKLDRSLNFYLILAASVPMLAVCLLAIIQSGNYTALVVLSIAGVAGFVVAYLLVNMIRADKSAILELASPQK